jgi:hypothetical protein
MPTINLTDNTTLNLTASSADNFATLNRYLRTPLTFLTGDGLAAIAGQTVGALDPDAFPIAASATGAGKFALEGTSLNVSLAASASVNSLTAASAASFLSSLQLPANAAGAGLISFQLKGTFGVGDTATVSDFTLGIRDNASVALTSYCPAAGTDRFTDAVERAMAALTIPNDLNDLKSLPAGAICQVDASSCLKFTASVTYDVLNNPLATTSIANLPSIAINATAGATVEGTVTHTSDHTVTIARLPAGPIHLSVSLTNTDDFETSLTVSAGVSANVGSQDALEFLLGKISPDSGAELKKMRADLPPEKLQQLSSDIKAAIDATLCSSLQVSLKAALDDSHSNNRVFLYEVDLNALDADSSAALQSALAGDFTQITRPNAALTGIRELDSALTVTSKTKHSLALHLLGIYNWGSTSEFVEKSKIDYTHDTHEIVLSDEKIEVMTDNLDAEKLRHVLMQGITLTLPASANTPQSATPISAIFFDSNARTDPPAMRQFVNVLNATGAPGANGATALLNQNLKNYGTASLFLGLNLTPPQCKQLFMNSNSQAYDWTRYADAVCRAQQTILAGDTDHADRLKLYAEDMDFWTELKAAGSQSNQEVSLASRGILLRNVSRDIVTVIWWSDAMANYAKALVGGKPLAGCGKEVVKDATLGFDEPWLVLAVWNMLGKPAVESRFTSPLLERAAAAPA